MGDKLQELKDDIAAQLDRTDGAMAAFLFEKRLWGFKPPADEDLGYKLLAVQILTLAECYEKSPRVIMAEVNCAIKDVIK